MIIGGTDNLKKQVLLSSSVDHLHCVINKILFARIYCVYHACVCVFKSVSMCESHHSYRMSSLVALHILLTKAGSHQEPSTNEFSLSSQTIFLFLPPNTGITNCLPQRKACSCILGIQILLLALIEQVPYSLEHLPALRH